MFPVTGFAENTLDVTVYTKCINHDKIFAIINICLVNNVQSDFLDEYIEAVLRLAVNMAFLKECSTVY